MGILEDMQGRLESNTRMVETHSGILGELSQRLHKLEQVQPPTPPPAPEPGWNPIWLDSLKVPDSDAPAFKEKHGGYVHQGLQGTENRLTLTSEGLEVSYKSRPWNESDGPRCETGLWSEAHPGNRIFQREPLDGKLRRYRLEVYLPKDESNPRNIGERCIVWQAHGNNTKNPCLSFDLFWGRLRVFYRTESMDRLLHAPKELKPIPTDRWIQLQVEAVWSLTDGIVRASIDGEEYLLLEGETTYKEPGPPPGPDGPYIRCGQYHPADRKNATVQPAVTRRVLLRNLSIEERT